MSNFVGGLLPTRNPRRAPQDVLAEILAMLEPQGGMQQQSSAPPPPGVGQELQQFGQLPGAQQPSQQPAQPNAFTDTFAFGLPGLTSYAAAGMDYGADWMDGKEPEPFDDYLMDARKAVQKRVDARSPQMSDKERGFYEGLAPMMLPAGAVGAGLARTMMPAAKTTFQKAMKPAATAIGGTGLFGLGYGEGNMSAGPEVPVDDASRTVDGITTGAGTLALAGLGMKLPAIAGGVKNAVSGAVNSGAKTAGDAMAGVNRLKNILKIDDARASASLQRGDAATARRDAEHYQQQQNLARQQEPELIARALHNQESGAYQKSLDLLSKSDRQISSVVDEVATPKGMKVPILSGLREKISGREVRLPPMTGAPDRAQVQADVLAEFERLSGGEIRKARGVVQATQKGLDRQNINKYLDPEKAHADLIAGKKRQLELDEFEVNQRNIRMDKAIKENGRLKKDLERLSKENAARDPSGDLIKGIVGAGSRGAGSGVSGRLGQQNLYTSVSKSTRSNILLNILKKLNDGTAPGKITGDMVRHSRTNKQAADHITQTLIGNARKQSPKNIKKGLLSLLDNGAFAIPIAGAGLLGSQLPGTEAGLR